MLQLTRKLVGLDLETTGTNVPYDRIVRISLHAVVPGYEDPFVWDQLVNPGRPIPPDATEIHGITDQMVANAPNFAEVASTLWSWLQDGDYFGYNLLAFDIPMIVKELGMLGIKFDYSNAHVIDVQKIFFQKEPRTLAGAVKFYLGREFPEAHNSVEDNKATFDVLLAQLERYPELPRDVPGLYRTLVPEHYVDPDGKLQRQPDGEIKVCFGQWNGYTLKGIMQSDHSYLQWMLSADFHGKIKEEINKLMQTTAPW